MGKLVLTAGRMYEGFLAKDPEFEGLFFVGVKTTGIFCRPTCTAKKPKLENIEFFLTSKDALTSGYRPCKICRPMEMAGGVPKEINDLLKDLHKNPAYKISDYELIQRGFEPNRIRRWFLNNHNMTFQAYQRLLRINEAFGSIQQGEKVIETAFKSGYGSLSGFAYAYKKVTSLNPSDSKGKKRIFFSRFATPLGMMFAAATENGICLLEFADRKMLESELKFLQKSFKSPILLGANKHLENLQLQIDEYFAGNRKEFDIPLVIVGTDFQKSVWIELQKIPYGKTISYKAQAEALGNIKAVRAVANANGLNKISIIIPCHRVIGEDGSLTGYGGGLWRKKWLLDHEKHMMS